MFHYVHVFLRNIHVHSCYLLLEFIRFSKNSEVISVVRCKNSPARATAVFIMIVPFPYQFQLPNNFTLGFLLA